MANRSRLKKVALMTPDMFENTVDQISDEGREILKAIEDYKFHIDQTLRIVKNDPALSNIIMQKKKNLDHAAQDLYNIVFEIENIDITEQYNQQEQDIQMEQNAPKQDPNKDDSDELDNNNSAQGPSNPAPAPDDGADSTDKTGPSAKHPVPNTPPTPPAPPSKGPGGATKGDDLGDETEDPSNKQQRNQDQNQDDNEQGGFDNE